MVKGHGTSEYVVWMCLGSMFLCLGTVEMNKMRKNKKRLDVPFIFPKKSFFKKVGVRHILGLTNWNIVALGCDELFEFVTSSSHFVTYSIL